MAGVLSMKMIKCHNSHTRTAQACDRCRSKKIRCDGLHPCCSQCASAGFECKTSDKLSRRAFPRGYTESLENRVRQLEAEVKTLKEQLDTKGEQLDVVSLSPYGPYILGRGQAGSSPVGKMHGLGDCFSGKETVKDGIDVFYSGDSSGFPFVDSFTRNLQKGGHLKHDVDIRTFFTSHGSEIRQAKALLQVHGSPPSRLASDYLVTTFFQQYHPLFPVLHGPSFLKQYEQLIALPEASTTPDNTLSGHSLAQLYLVFAIAARNSEMHNEIQARRFDHKWQSVLESIFVDTSIETVQCLILAQLYCFLVNDHGRLAQYNSICVGAAIRLGLCKTQKGTTSDTLDCEMRRKLFWCVYCLDSFSAAMLGLPRLFKDVDITAEYPLDIDDGYINEQNFLSIFSSDSSIGSSAVALFRCSRVLARVLDIMYPTAVAHDGSLRRLEELQTELEGWRAELAPHLWLEFVNGVPGTKLVHCQPLLLTLAYHYTRVLIHRPNIHFGETVNVSGPSFLPFFESSESIIKIITRLSERGLGFSFCLNRNHLLIISGFAILSSAVHCQHNGSSLRGICKLISRVIHELEMAGSSSVYHFRKVAEAIVHVENLTANDLGTFVGSKEPDSTLHDVGTPISPTSLQNLEMQSLREVTPLSEFTVARVNRQIETLSTASLNSTRRVDAQIMTSSPRSTSQATPRRSSSVTSLDIVGGIQTMGVRLYDPRATDMGHVSCVYDTTQRMSPTSTSKHDISKGFAHDDEWTTTFINSVQVPDTYGGEEDHTHLQSVVTPPPPMTTIDLALAPDTRDNQSECIGHTIYGSSDRHHYSDTLAPEQISSFGGGSSGNMNDGLNQPQFTPPDLSDWQLWMV